MELGYLEIEAQKVGKDTTYSRIIHLVEEAQEAKAPAQQFLERFARYYTPGIIILAVLALAISRDLRLSLTLLVIACPGALVIRCPSFLCSGHRQCCQARCALQGGGIHLEEASRINAIAFDKTGTLTVGKPQVVAVHTAEDKGELLRLVAEQSGTANTTWQEPSCGI